MHPAKIHPYTNISPKARIGENVHIEAFTTIEEDVVIGEGTWIGPNVTIMNGARIGKNCKIFPGAVIAAIPQDLKFKGEYTTVEIGDNTTVREFVTINRGTSDKEKTIVGSNCLLMAYVHVAHDCILGDNIILANCVQVAGHVVIEDYAILEGVVAVQQFVRIGRHSFIAGGSLVRKNVPPYVRAAKEPLSYVGVNSIGLKRRNYGQSDIHTIEDIYRILFVKNSNLGRGMEEVEMAYGDNPYAKEIVSFIKNSPDGVIKGLSS